jgi:2-dehydropantoate 2-reductase
MKIAIVGIGGVGGYYDGKLAREYEKSPEHEIIFIARGERLAAIKASDNQVLNWGYPHHYMIKYMINF